MKPIRFASIYKFVRSLFLGFIPAVFLLIGSYFIGLGISDYSLGFLGLPQFSKNPNFISLAFGIVLWILSFIGLYYYSKKSLSIYGWVISQLLLFLISLFFIIAIFTPIFDYFVFRIAMTRTICPLYSYGFYDKSPQTQEVLGKICKKEF